MSKLFTAHVSLYLNDQEQDSIEGMRLGMEIETEEALRSVTLELLPDVLRKCADDMDAARAQAQPKPEPLFFVDTVTGEPCPTEGNRLCTITDPNHLHRDGRAHDGSQVAPEDLADDGDLPGMWSQSDFMGGDPDERSYAERERQSFAQIAKDGEAWVEAAAPPAPLPVEDVTDAEPTWREKAIAHITHDIVSGMHTANLDTLEVWASREDNVDEATYTDDKGNEWDVAFGIKLVDFEIHGEHRGEDE